MAGLRVVRVARRTLDQLQAALGSRRGQEKNLPRLLLSRDRLLCIAAAPTEALPRRCCIHATAHFVKLGCLVLLAEFDVGVTSNRT